MKNTIVVLTSLVLLAAFASPAPAQTLADAAKREAERRARLKEPAKVFTSADLEGLSSRDGAAPAARPETLLAPVGVDAAGASDAPVSPEAAAAAASSGDATTGKPTARLTRDEEHWRERAKVIRDRLARLQSDAAALDGRVKVLNTEMDGAPGSGRAPLAADLRQTQAALARVQEELGLIQGEWRRFEDRAVAAKIPSAWIR